MYWSHFSFVDVEILGTEDGRRSSNNSPYPPYSTDGSPRDWSAGEPSIVITTVLEGRHPKSLRFLSVPTRTTLNRFYRLGLLHRRHLATHGQGIAILHAARAVPHPAFATLASKTGRKQAENRPKTATGRRERRAGSQTPKAKTPRFRTAPRCRAHACTWPRIETLPQPVRRRPLVDLPTRLATLQMIRPTG